MNVRASPHDLDHIRGTIGAALRVEHDHVAEPAPQSLMDLLRLLEIMRATPSAKRSSPM
jgi:hypothetical protein